MSLKLPWVRNEVTKTECAHSLGAKSTRNVKLRERHSIPNLCVGPDGFHQENTMTFAENDCLKIINIIYVRIMFSLKSMDKLSEQSFEIM